MTKTLYRNREGENPFHPRLKGAALRERIRAAEVFVAELAAKHGVDPYKGGEHAHTATAD